MSFFRTQLEIYLKGLDVNADRVIDIGSSQLSIKNRVKNFNVKELIGLDLEKPHRGNKADIVCDINKPKYIDKKYKESFDWAFCLEVSEYWFDPETALLNISSFLKRGGTLVISFQFLYPLHPPTGTDYLRYTRYGALKLLDLAGFQVEEYIPRVVKNKELWERFMAEEGYRFDRSVDPSFLQETGCIIRCTKK